MTHYHYFVYDPENGSEFFPTEDQALTYAEEVLQGYRDAAHCLGWDELTDQIVVGKITHEIEKCDVVKRKGALDDDGYDENGVYFGLEEFDEVFNYRFVKVGESHE